MRRSPLVRSLGLRYFGCVFLLFGVMHRALGQGPPAELPKIADLKSFPYEKTAQPTLSSSPSYQDLLNTIQSAEAFARGKQLLPGYRDPIPTRGTSGIAIFKRIAPSVVLVVVGDVKGKGFEPSGLGAGVVINGPGDILTNWHVINGYSEAVIFLKPNGSADIEKSMAFVARVVSKNELLDLALLRILNPPTELPSIPVGGISSVQVAEDIHVIGHPNGNLWSYSTGVVSQIRDNYTWSYSDGSKHQAKVLQLQTAINPGNSGGPVIDDQGRLLGLIAMAEGGQNLDYAIASDVIQLFLSNAATMRTRGGENGQKTPNAEYMLAHLKDGRTVLKVAYPGLVEYLISDDKGKAFTLAAETSNGTQLTAWKPNSFSGFKDWIFVLRGGLTLRATGGGPTPDRFNAN